MNQSVIAFSNSTARSSAITSPVEGMITYLEDSNSYQSYDGSAWVGLVPQSPNAIINGAFEINQRGFTSTTTNTTFTFDRWISAVAGDGTTTYTPQTFSPGDVPAVGFPSGNFLRIVTASQTAAGVLSRIDQRIEDVRAFSGQTVTVSFYAKSATGTPKIAVEFGQSFGGGGSTAVNINAGQVTLGTSWTRHSLTVAIPSITGKTVVSGSALQLRIAVSAGSDFDARTGSLGIQSNTFDIWGVQLEEGTVATPFRRNANSLQGELAACQRYYQQYSGIIYLAESFGGAYRSNIQFPVTMRANPTITATGYSGGGTQIVSEFITVGGFQTGANNPTSGPSITAYTATAEL
jgi:hypothetical protein